MGVDRVGFHGVMGDPSYNVHVCTNVVAPRSTQLQFASDVWKTCIDMLFFKSRQNISKLQCGNVLSKIQNSVQSETKVGYFSWYLYDTVLGVSL